MNSVKSSHDPGVVARGLAPRPTRAPAQGVRSNSIQIVLPVV